MPPELCKRFMLTLEILRPKERPSIEELLELLLPYILQRGLQASQQNNWKNALLWVRPLREHFDEIQAEIDDENHDGDGTFSETMMHHMLTHCSLYIRSLLVFGVCQYQQTEFETAQKTFLAAKDLLERYEYGCDKQLWNTCFLKVINNLAACYFRERLNA